MGRPEFDSDPRRLGASLRLALKAKCMRSEGVVCIADSGCHQTVQCKSGDSNALDESCLPGQTGRVIGRYNRGRALKSSRPMPAVIRQYGWAACLKNGKKPLRPVLAGAHGGTAEIENCRG